jgi:Protein of unknown function (DUF3500)
MARQLTRRQMLQLTVLGGLGGIAAACQSRMTSTIEPSPTRAIPTSTRALQPTRVPATAAPTTAAAAEPPAATAIPTEQPVRALLAANMASAAAQLLDLLDEGQRAKATYAFADPERTRWHWTTPGNFPRNGLPLREMTPEQRDKAMALLQSGVSTGGFQKALDIMSLQNDLGNDPELYFVTVFGIPTSGEPWGWRFEGHHLSRHFTVVNDQVALMPFFLGSWPTVSSNGLKAMEREEWAARELITSLEGQQREVTLFQPRTLTRHVTQNQAFVTPLDPVGIPVTELDQDRQALVNEIIHAYLDTLPDEVAAAQHERVAKAGPENIRFGWAGPIEPRRPHYYRLQGPTFLLEHDNSRNGGTHIHSVWRDFSDDFGQNLA